MRTKLSTVALCLSLLPALAFAQAPAPKAVEPILVATVNVQDVTLVKQDNNVFTLGFNISNREGVQPEIVYSINLMQGNKEGKYTVVDQKIYKDDVLNLGENTSVHKEIVYVAPAYLTGSYALKVEARNADALRLGYVQLPNEVLLQGSGSYVRIENDSCYLTIDGDKTNKHYPPMAGIDVAKTENLVIHCTLTNLVPKNITISPVIQTYYRSTFGKLISTEKKDPITIASGKTQDFTLPIPKATEPQAYDAVLSFVDDKDLPISQQMIFHYVLQGESATIQNLTLDKDSYKQGDIALATFFWSGSAMGFAGSRAGTQYAEVGLSAVFNIAISDGNNTPCAQPFTQKLSDTGGSGVEKISIPIIKDCMNPRISQQIVTDDGVVLAQKTIAVTTKTSQSEGDITMLYVYAAIAFLLIGGMILFIVKKTKKPEIIALFLVLASFGYAGEARADTWTFKFQADYGDTETVTVTTNLSTLNPIAGSSVSASGDVVGVMCSNGMDQSQWYVPEVFTAKINGVTKSILSSSQSFTVPSAPGTYSAQFYVQLKDIYYYPPISNVGNATHNVSYTVVGSGGACGTAEKEYTSTETAYSGTFCASGTASPASPAFPAIGSSVSWTCSGSPVASCSATRVAAATILKPSLPTITPGASNTYFVGEAQTFTFLATDTNSPAKTITYGVDYRNGTTLVDYLSGDVFDATASSDTWFPSFTTYVTSGTPKTWTKTWTTPGTYQFRVQVKNDASKYSGWVVYYVTISDPIPAVCGTNNRSNYVYADTSYTGTFCEEGNPTPATPAFPAPGATIPWTCSGAPSANCSATRSASMPPNTPTITASTGNTYRVGETQSFTLAATDPNSPSKSIRYGVDYRDGAGVDYLSTAVMDLLTDAWLPAGGGTAPSVPDVLYYALNESTGTVADDTSTIGTNNGNLVNTPTWTTGKIGGGLAFASASLECLSTITSATLPADFTFTTWFKPSSFGGMIASKWNDGDTYVAYLVNSTTINVQSDNVGTVKSFTVPAMSTGTWYFLSVTRTSGTVRVYLNGVQSATGGQSIAGTFTINQFGTYADRTQGYFYNGALDDIRIYNTAKSAADILAMYQYVNGGGGTYVTSGTSQTFTKAWATPGTYIFRARTQNNDYFLNSAISAPFTVNIISEPLINGAINPASCKNYAKTETAFVTPFCSSGTVKATNSSGTPLSPVQDPTFPAVGATAYWKCFASGGGTDSALCTSVHLAITCGTAIDSPKIVAPSTNLCLDGTTPVAATSAVTLSANGKTYQWTCGASPSVACSVAKTIVKVDEE